MVLYLRPQARHRPSHRRPPRLRIQSPLLASCDAPAAVLCLPAGPAPPISPAAAQALALKPAATTTLFSYFCSSDGLFSFYLFVLALVGPAPPISQAAAQALALKPALTDDTPFELRALEVCLDHVSSARNATPSAFIVL